MKTLPDHAHELALDKLADIDGVDFAKDAQGLMDIWVQLGADVLTLKAHAASSHRKAASHVLPKFAAQTAQTAPGRRAASRLLDSDERVVGDAVSHRNAPD
jgi:hypothetical protein